MTRCKPGGHMINQLFTAEIWLVLMKTNQLRLDQSLPEQTANRKLTSCQKGEISERNNSQTHTHTHTQTEAHILRQTCTCTHTSLNVYICRHTHTHTAAFPCAFLWWDMTSLLEECHHINTHIYISNTTTQLTAMVLFSVNCTKRDLKASTTTYPMIHITVSKTH